MIRPSSCIAGLVAGLLLAAGGLFGPAAAEVSRYGARSTLSAAS